MIGKNIQFYRDLREMKGKDLAAKVGCSVGALSHIEKGSRQPSVDMLYKIADALDVSVINLVLDEKETNQIPICNGFPNQLLCDDIQYCIAIADDGNSALFPICPAQWEAMGRHRWKLPYPYKSGAAPHLLLRFSGERYHRE